MSDYRFTVLDMVAEPYAVAPQLTARLRIEETTGQRIHAIALRCPLRGLGELLEIGCSASGSAGPTP